jgi:DNA-binding transcriptional MerR regulator
MAKKDPNRRRHYKVEQLSCREMIDKMLQSGVPYEEIQAAVRAAGESIGKASLSRYYNQYQAAAEKIARTREAMQVLVESVQDRPDLDLGQAASNLMMQGLLDRIALAGSSEFQDLTLDKAGKLIANLQRADVARERLKLQYDKGVDAAVAAIEAKLKEALANRPELAEQLRDAVKEAAEQAKAEVR